MKENESRPLKAAPGVDIRFLSSVTPLQEAVAGLPWEGPAHPALSHRAHAPGHAGLLVPEDGALVVGGMAVRH